MSVAPQRHRRFLPPEIEETSGRQLFDSSINEPSLNTCPKCRWSEQFIANRWKCRRWPPVTNVNRPGESMFPIVGEKDYCGEFSQ